MKKLRFIAMFFILILIALGTVQEDLFLYTMQITDSKQIKKPTIETASAGGKDTIRTIEVVKAPIRIWESAPQDPIEEYAPLLKRCSKLVFSGQYTDLNQINILVQSYSIVYYSTKEYRQELLFLSEKVLNDLRKICVNPRQYSLDESLSVISSYLTLLDLWIKSKDAKLATEFEVLLEETIALLLNFNVQSDDTETNVFVQHAKLAAVLQRAAALKLIRPEAYPLSDCAALADIHVNYLLDKSNITMGIPLWIESNTISFDTHASCLYALSVYKKYGGSVTLPFTSRQVDGALSVFIDAQEKADVADLIYAHGFWIYPPPNAHDRQMASLEPIALSSYTSRYLGMGKLLLISKDVILSNYLDSNGFTMSYKKANSSKIESHYADALALFVLINCMYEI